MIKVRRIMTKEVLVIDKESSIYDAAKIVESKYVSGLVVIERGAPIAVVDENDILSAVISGKKKVKDVMDKNFLIISPNAKFSEIMRFLREKEIRRFPVVENDRLIGLVTDSDIVESIRDFTRFDQIVQEIILVIFGSATLFFLLYFSPIGTSLRSLI